MNAKIICQNIKIEKINKALVLGEYQKDDLGIQSIKYRMYSRNETIMIEFDSQFEFCQLLFVIAVSYTHLTLPTKRIV